MMELCVAPTDRPKFASTMPHVLTGSTLVSTILILAPRTASTLVAKLRPSSLMRPSRAEEEIKVRHADCANDEKRAMLFKIGSLYGVGFNTLTHTGNDYG
jgi:hypothetical protein